MCLYHWSASSVIDSRDASQHDNQSRQGDHKKRSSGHHRQSFDEPIKSNQNAYLSEVVQCFDRSNRVILLVCESNLRRHPLTPFTWKSSGKLYQTVCYTVCLHASPNNYITVFLYLVLLFAVWLARCWQSAHAWFRPFKSTGCAVDTGCRVNMRVNRWCMHAHRINAGPQFSGYYSEATSCSIICVPQSLGVT